MVLILDPQENSLRPHEWARLYPDPLARFQKRPRLNRASRQRNGSDGSNLVILHWLRPIPGPYHPHEAWGRQNWQPLVRIKVAKDVSWKQRHINFDDSVDSPTLCPVKRGKSRVSLTSQSAFDDFFVPRSHV